MSRAHGLRRTRTSLRRLCFAALAAVLLATSVSRSTAQAGNALPFVVNSTADGHDSAPGDGVCQTATAGECTLRAAIEEANALPGPQVISFNIPGVGIQTIQVNSSGLGPSPVISTPMTIDATTQPGWATSAPVVIDGTLDPGPSNGLTVSTGGEGTMIKGLRLQHFVNGIGVFNAGSVTLDADGLVNNSNSGLALFHSPNNTVGVTTGNLFSANGNGIWIYGPESSGNIIQHNAIGTDLSLTKADGNYVGVLVQDAPDNQIGIVGSGNLISGNKSVGVQIGGGANATRNRVQRNLIGTDITGMVAIPNGIDGVVVGDGATNNVIGGTAGAMNFISGNAQVGVLVRGSATFPDTTGNIVSNNWIGTNIANSAAIPNAIGVVVTGANAHDNSVGAATPDGRNFIVGNTSAGVVLFDNTYQNTIQNNWIGYGIANGVQFTNQGDGIAIFGGAHDNRIGGVTVGMANDIIGNDGVGVAVGDTGTHNSIRGNSISFSGGFGPTLGIDLQPNGVAGVTLNDPLDADTGPNNLQNFPVLSTVIVDAATTRFIGTLNSTPNSSFDLDFFNTNASCDASGYGEGALYLGSTSVQTDAAGNASFDVTLPVFSYPGAAMTATATSATGDTSEFSACRDSVEVAPPTSTPTAAPTLTATATPSPMPPTSTPTSTSTATATAPSTLPCLTAGQKVALVVGIMRRLGTHVGNHRYAPRFDVNGDGVIDVGDLLAVLRAPACDHPRARNAR